MENKAKLESLDVPSLEKRSKKANASLKQNQESINRELNKIQGIKLPTRVLKRYEKEFGTGKSKFAFKSVLFGFALVFFILLFFQPSLSIFQEGDEIVIRNNSGRELTNVKVNIIKNPAELFGEAKEAYFAESFAEFKEVRLPITEENIYLTTAHRQMPSITFIIIPKTMPFESNNNENNSDSTNPLKKKLEEDKNGNK